MHFGNWAPTCLKTRTLLSLMIIFQSDSTPTLTKTLLDNKTGKRLLKRSMSKKAKEGLYNGVCPKAKVLGKMHSQLAGEPSFTAKHGTLQSSFPMRIVWTVLFFLFSPLPIMSLSRSLLSTLQSHHW